MIFYGDRQEERSPRAELDALAGGIAACDRLPAGAERHGRLAGLLARAGALAQALGDEARRAAGRDVLDPAERAAMTLAMDLAAALVASWRSGGRVLLRDPDCRGLGAGACAALRSLALPECVCVRIPEGQILYGVHAEAYAEAARELPPGPLCVIGIRSIGTSLAAAVAAGAGRGGIPLTVRPSGHPFHRTVALDAALEHALGDAVRAGATFAVVDEGPGLSGSSFAAVVARLEALGADPEAIRLFPSHAGPPGPASPEARAAFGRHRRHLASFERLFLGGGPLALPDALAPVIGSPDAEPEDLGAGAWRARLLPTRADWPPTQGWRERRKLLLRADGRAWLVRFAGVGEYGQRKLARACRLAEAGLAVAPVGLAHGYLAEPWLDGARPAHVARPPERALRQALRAHIVFLARSFPANSGEGASPGALLAMTRANAVEAFGPEGGLAVDRLAPLADRAEAEARPVRGDAKLQRWEWLVLPDGRIVKADALDHHAGHELTGAQDALFDVAGAALELGLDRAEARALADAIRAEAPGASPALLPFYEAAWSAIELARWTELPPDPDPAEEARRAAARARYREALGRALSAPG